MKNKWNTILCNVAEEVFESLAFLLIMPEEDDLGPDDTTGVTASITFDGPFEGALFLCVSEEMLPSVAANMLGSLGDEEPAVSQQHDAYKELLNVICGNLLPQVAGTDAVFNVHTAQVLPCQQIPPQYQQRPPTATAHLNLDMGTAQLTFFVNQPVSADTNPST